MKRVINLVNKLFTLSLLSVIHCGKEYDTILTGPRLHFSGSFLCDPATVNNDIENYDITSFLPHHALSLSEGGKGLYSPRGTNSFLLMNVRVKSVCYTNQDCTENKEIDDVVGREVKDNPRSTAKIVDIDPQDPVGATQIWAMKIRIPGVLSSNAGVLTMRNMWRREVSGKKNIDGVLTGKFHGTLKDIALEDNAVESRYVEELRYGVEQSISKQLSIRFVLDMFRFNHTGRIYGTIGCHGYNSPQSLLFSRILLSHDRNSFNKASFAVDKEHKAIVFDFGSSFLTNENGTHIVNESEYYLITYQRNRSRGIEKNMEDKNWKQNREILGIVPLSSDDWLTKSAGFITLKVSENQLEEVSRSPLEVIKAKGEGENAIYQGVILKEKEDGIQIFTVGDLVFRKESGDELAIDFIASKFGRPQPDVEVLLMHQCERDEKELYCEPKLPLPVTVKTDKNGVARARFKLPVLATPRKVIDGQVYKILYFDNAKNVSKGVAMEFDWSQYQGIVLKVFDQTEYKSDVTWVDHIHPIFSQYANLFPVMKGATFDISNYYSVIKMKKMIITSLNLPMNHSSYMPVTRDLSQRKRRMIADWLSKDKPNIGKVDRLMNIQHLRSLLQKALEVEHATIPPYFTALWSIRDNYNRQIHRIIKTVVKQEMLHMGLVANLINAVGGHPSFIHSTFILNYPSNLPGGIRPDLIVSLEKLSRNVSRNVFMKIEEPDLNVEHRELRDAIFKHMKLLRCEKVLEKENDNKECRKCVNMTKTAKRGCPDVVKEYLERMSDKKSGGLDLNEADDVSGSRELLDYKGNIAAFYTHVLLVVAHLTDCGANESLFTGKKELQLTTDNYHYGNGKLIEVNDYVSAVTAIKTIIEEGEGTSDCDPKVHYFDSHDDISHYTMFETITKGHRIRQRRGEKRKMEGNSTNHDCDPPYEYSGKAVKFHPEGIWPIKKNARQSDYKEGSLPAIRSKIFTVLYNRLLATLHKAFNGEKEYFKNSLFLMYAVDYYGRQLVRFSIDENSSPYVGPNAAPIFKWMPVDLKSMKHSNVNIGHWHKQHVVGEQYKAVKRKEAKAGNRNDPEGGRKSLHHKDLHSNSILEGRLKNTIEHREPVNFKNYRRMRRKYFDHATENEARNNYDNSDNSDNSDNYDNYDRERKSDHREVDDRNDQRDYAERLRHYMKLYKDIKDEMDMDRIIEGFWQRKYMQDAYNDYEEDDDDDDDNNDHEKRIYQKLK